MSGKKIVYLVEPAHSKYVYPLYDQKKKLYSSSLPTNLQYDSIQHKNFPLFKHAQVHKIVLQSNNCLYIPFGWWHQVETSSSSGTHKIKKKEIFFLHFFFFFFFNSFLKFRRKLFNCNQFFLSSSLYFDTQCLFEIQKRSSRKLKEKK